MSRPVYVTPAERIAELVRAHGSYRKAAAAIGVEHAYLYRVAMGKKDASDAMLDAIGLNKHVSIKYSRQGA